MEPKVGDLSEIEWLGFTADNGCVIAVATVLSNWHNVLRAINMASSTVLRLSLCGYKSTDREL